MATTNGSTAIRDKILASLARYRALRIGKFPCAFWRLSALPGLTAIAKKDRPIKPERDSAYPTKTEIALGLLKEFKVAHSLIKIKGVLADALFGESLFLRKLVLGIPAQASSKNLTRPLMPPAAPIRPRHLVPTQQGVGT
ncbi:hypothetical protein [Bathymodiolus japonicus methanotrophic gill symbiont]|uniref:hypothetical protein n=1 Tax=Bathymodiolus japonicus methanotrophic gill symbiont TaxID=113269 RepID=UPI001C8DE19C|nr:hypothetical protein [Bathymodiolus japonicus methanotrophic gill symbiont]